MNVGAFIESQLAAWPVARANFLALEGVETKEFDVDGMPFKVQFNPARIASSGAKVDARSLAERPCFLCEKNRPAEQTGTPWRGYTVLINPFPIFPRHLTVPDNRHIAQQLRGRMADMIALADELDGYTVFYNGPRCGASAPDHMHFQAGNTDFLTLPQALDEAEQKVIASEGDSVLSLVDSLPLKLFVIDAATPDEGERLFERLYAALPVPEGDYEPMMNVLAWRTPAGVRVAVVPRKRHRPSFYGTEGDGCMLVSPASVDMGGVFITPRPADFGRFGAETVRRLLDELTLNDSEINEIAANV